MASNKCMSFTKFIESMRLIYFSDTNVRYVYYVYVI